VRPSVMHCGSWRSVKLEQHISATPTRRIEPGRNRRGNLGRLRSRNGGRRNGETVRDTVGQPPATGWPETGPSALPHSCLRVLAEGARCGGYDSRARNPAGDFLGETRGSSSRLRRESRHLAPDRTKPHRRSCRTPRLVPTSRGEASAGICARLVGTQDSDLSTPSRFRRFHSSRQPHRPSALAPVAVTSVKRPPLWGAAFGGESSPGNGSRAPSLSSFEPGRGFDSRRLHHSTRQRKSDPQHCTPRPIANGRAIQRSRTPR